MPRSCSARRNRHRIVSRGVTASFISTLEWWFAFPHPPGIYYHATYSGSRDRLLVAMAVSFPRPVFLEDVALIVCAFGALLGTAFEKLFKVVDVLPIGVGERS